MSHVNCRRSYNFGAHSTVCRRRDVTVHVVQDHAAILLVGLCSVLAPAGKLSLKRTLSEDISHFFVKETS